MVWMLRTTTLWASLTLALLPSAAMAAPSVDMFGASWCGPCRYVKALLDRNGVAYTYHDIDTDAGLAAYSRARGSTQGIPLVVVNGKQIVGANLEALNAALGRPMTAAAAPQRRARRRSTVQYGGRSGPQWQRDFQAFRGQLARLDRAVDRLSEVAADNIEREQLAKLKEQRQIVQASLIQLNNEAAKVALPFKFRR